MADNDNQRRVKSALAAKPWFGFDLDDTLHEFRRASSAATAKTLEKISRQHDIPMTSLCLEYSEILREKTLGAFCDGKTSYEYRRDRFGSLMARFSLAPDAEFLSQLLEVYENTLNDSLRLKDGALELFLKLKAAGRKIAVITEGPQDAQERTLKHLGIAEHVDFLATTNFFKVSKTEGLFPKVLGHLGIPAADMIYFGDSLARDITPAMEAGILSVHFAEHAETSFDADPPHVKTLQEIVLLIL
ncbi:had-superfamily subfamily variant 1 [Colletotrichum musicola]|uniref:Had-superfamily subfamily variant 1 n=1 Tax=Colletotrichum musicola TaxID=2175873 RepID=A0A8H6NTK8_9PEZI|nr:had-superfamily subfamily variant 1 [Colletotrichum musicola]